jgi:hypothetical protein
MQLVEFDYVSIRYGVGLRVWGEGFDRNDERTRRARATVARE